MSTLKFEGDINPSRSTYVSIIINTKMRSDDVYMGEMHNVFAERVFAGGVDAPFHHIQPVLGAMDYASEKDFYVEITKS